MEIVETKINSISYVALVLMSFFVFTSSVSHAQVCTMSEYKASRGMSAAAINNGLTITWDGDKNQEIRVRLTINNSTPTIQELSVRHKGRSWGTLASNVTPEFSFVSGIRRIDRETKEGLEENGIKEITPKVYEKYKWDPFWDAPLNIPGSEDARQTLGLPRKPEEVKRGTATYHANGGIFLCQRGSRGRNTRRRHGVYSRRSLQAIAGLPGNDPPLSYEVWNTIGGRRPRCRD